MTDNISELPEGFRRRVLAEPGVNGEALLRSLAEPPSTGVRLNPLRSGRLPGWLEGAETVPWCPDGRHLAERPDFTLTPALHAGGFYVQDPSSMIHQTIVGRLVDDAPVRVLDVCAAPGGKSTAAIAALPEGSLMVANEVMPQRVTILAENLLKWGWPATIVTSARASALGRLAGAFDIVMVDAPCSGEGMMRKEAKAVEQWSEGLVESCARLQREILDDVIPALRPGGHLIYSTCTFSRAENEEMAEMLAERYGLESVDLHLEDSGVARGWSEKVVCYRFMPHITRGEGLFVAVFKAPGENAPRFASRRQPRKGKGNGKNAIPALPKLLKNQERYTPVAVGGRIHLIPTDHLDIYNALSDNGIRMLAAGVEVGEYKRTDLVPAHSLALTSALDPGAFPDVPLSEEEAIAYLRCDNIPLPDGTPRGYVTVSCGGMRLGWMKNIGNRANNLYPKNWRIRK